MNFITNKEGVDYDSEPPSTHKKKQVFKNII